SSPIINAIPGQSRSVEWLRLAFIYLKKALNDKWTALVVYAVRFCVSRHGSGYCVPMPNCSNSWMNACGALIQAVLFPMALTSLRPRSVFQQGYLKSLTGLFSILIRKHLNLTRNLVTLLRSLKTMKRLNSWVVKNSNNIVVYVLSPTPISFNRYHPQGEACGIKCRSRF